MFRAETAECMPSIYEASSSKPCTAKQGGKKPWVSKYEVINLSLLQNLPH